MKITKALRLINRLLAIVPIIYFISCGILGMSRSFDYSMHVLSKTSVLYQTSLLLLLLSFVSLSISIIFLFLRYYLDKILDVKMLVIIIIEIVSLFIVSFLCFYAF